MSTEVEIVERLVRLETKLDMYLTRSDDHEKRVRRLERVSYTAIGLAVAAAGGTGVTALLGGG